MLLGLTLEGEQPLWELYWPSKVQAAPAILTPGLVSASPGMLFAALAGIHVGSGFPFPQLSMVTMATQPKHLKHSHIQTQEFQKWVRMYL